MEIVSSWVFRITRDADYEIEEDEAADLLETLEELVSQRHFGFSVRLEVAEGMPTKVRETLANNLKLAPEQTFTVEGTLGLSDLMELYKLDRPELRDPPYLPYLRPCFNVDSSADYFAAIRRRDVLLYHPYDSFLPVVDFIRWAAADPDVVAIKQTLYRVGKDSPIVKALMEAREDGKQVAVLVELKARFDEENNIEWARALERAGVHVVYGVLGLKTHAKMCLVVRREQGGMQRYVHIGTGNYNPKTAKLYTDLGLLSCREELGADLSDLFNYLTGYSRHDGYRKLLVAPLTLRSRMQELIEREIRHARDGNGGRIIAKMNSLVDADMIRLLYLASQAGVQIDLIVRGICCLRPGVAGVSENIRVISVIGRYLEHSRIFYFENRGEEDIYIGSADWMTRNLDRRVEAVVPIEDASLKQELKAVLNILLEDNRQAWEMRPDGQYAQRHVASGEEERASQPRLMARALAHH
jgi:polyphosphate kinase